MKREGEVNQCEEHRMKENEKPERERSVRSTQITCKHNEQFDQNFGHALCISISVNMTFLFVTYM